MAYMAPYTEFLLRIWRAKYGGQIRRHIRRVQYGGFVYGGFFDDRCGDTASTAVGHKKLRQRTKKLHPEYIAPKKMQRVYGGNENTTARELQSCHCNFKIADVSNLTL